MTEMLLYAGANLEATTRIGTYTPLHLAAKLGHAPVIEFLLQGGSDPNDATTTGGATPLHFAQLGRRQRMSDHPMNSLSLKV